MRDASGVRGSERIGDLRTDVGHFPDGEGRASQRHAIDDLGDDVRHAVLGADVEHRDNVGVIQRGDVARFLLESRETGWIRCEIRRQDF